MPQEGSYFADAGHAPHIPSLLRGAAMPTDSPAKPKPANPGAEKLTPEMQAAQAVVADAKAAVASAKLAVRSAQSRASKAAADVIIAKARVTKAAGKLGAEKLTPEEQRRRFIEVAREAGASEDEASFDEAIKRVTRKMPQPKG